MFFGGQFPPFSLCSGDLELLYFSRISCSIHVFDGTHLMSCHDANTVPVVHVPQSHRAVGRPGRQVVRVRVELYALEITKFKDFIYKLFIFLLTR